MLLINSDAGNNARSYSLISKRNNPVQKNSGNICDVFFKADKKKNDKKYENPINSGFEYLDAAKLTAAAGLAVAGRVMWEFFDLSALESKKDFRKFIIVALAIGAAAAVLSLPKNLYNRKVETFQRKKEMDVYARSNSAEQKLYERVDSEARKADEDQKKDLKESYLKLRAGKNQVPEFIKQYQK